MANLWRDLGFVDVEQTQWPGQGALNRQIEDRGNIPHHAGVRHPAISIPHCCGHGTSRLHHATHLFHRTAASGMNCKTSIEKARSKELSSNGKARASAARNVIRGSVFWA